MIRVLTAFFLLSVVAPICSGQTSQGSSWYVAPTGDDRASGTIEEPFATVQRAQTSAQPGDFVYLRGGVYVMQESQISQREGIYARITTLNKSGEEGRPITYKAYQEEKPVFDCSAVKPEGLRVTAFFISGSWLRLEGLEVIGVQVTIKDSTQSICFESQGSNNVFERLSMHDGQAIGIYHVRGSNNLFLNCDAWNNWDRTSEDGMGGNVDGFGCHPKTGSTGNVFRGCRAWFNSDDGFDCIGAYEAITFEHCWAFYNGYSPKFERLANGLGFKIGGFGGRSVEDLPKPIPRHVVRYCIAVGNKTSGFYANHHPGGSDWVHNSGYRNYTNFDMLGRQSDNLTDVDGYDHRLINNLSYGAKRDLSNLDAAKSELAGNSFSMGLELIDRDFVNLEEAQLMRPRQVDGSLPTISFLRPAPTGQLAKIVDRNISDPESQGFIGALGGATNERGFTIGLIGDSTVATTYGWGPAFSELVSDQIAVLNYAKNGATLAGLTRKLDDLLSQKPDYVLIQFGHNDMKKYGSEEYAARLRSYVEKVTQSGSKAIVLSSVTRRQFDENGMIVPRVVEGDRTLPIFAKAAKLVAKEEKVPFIDLNTVSIAHHNRIGPEASAAYNYEETDRTHFSETGAKAIAEIVIEELKGAAPELAGYLQK